MNQKHVKKSKKWPWVLGGLALVIAAGILFLLTITPDMPDMSFGSADVTRASIAETVVGTGTLESGNGSGDETDIEIPVDIKIDKIFVEIDDDVVAGDILATIDPLSLQHRIASVRSEIADLDVKIHVSKDDDDEEVIRTGISGRVKKIFTEKGDAVPDIMSQHGMLMLLSVDGKMAADIETSADLSIGDSVTVVRENGSRRTGEVSQVINEGYTVTLSDNGPRLGETVEVQSSDRTALGSGTLYINQPISIVASSGSVKTIHVSENDRVSRNSRLITLENVPLDSEYQQMLADRIELVDHLNTLLTLSETHTILATVGGSVIDILIADDVVISGDRLWAAAFTIEEDYDDAVFTIEVDELDILSIEIGQEVVIIFNALPDREFIGTIADIASSSHSQSGVAKYTVEVSLDKDESILLGMNATATIGISSQDDILTLPIEALQESSGNVFVFTARDEQTGALSGQRQLQTGISDGLIVEIISGLSEGETVYYAVRNTNNDFGFGPGRGMGGGSGGSMVVSVGDTQSQQGGGDR